MSIKVNDNIRALGPKPLDSKYFNATNIPYANSAEVLAAININERHEGLKVRIGSADYEFGADKITLTVTGGGGGGGGTWGSITGDLADQTDLQDALDLKAIDANVVHKTGAETITGIKTIDQAGELDFTCDTGEKLRIYPGDGENSFDISTGGLYFRNTDNSKSLNLQNPATNLTGNRSISYPDKDGIFAVTSDLDVKVDKVTGERLVTAAEITKLGNTSGANTGDQDLSLYELLSSKQTDLTASATKYPTVNAVVTGLALKVDKVVGKSLLADTEVTRLLAITGTNTGDQDLSGKVDVVFGKGLSTEDYTTTEKTKLAGIAAAATANDTDVNLKARANHTGTQTASTISDFNSSALSAAPAETTTTLGALTNGAMAKATPVDADMMLLMDSAASNVAKKLSWANVKTTLKTYIEATAFTISVNWRIEKLGAGVAANVAAWLATAVNTASVGQLHLPKSAVDYTGTLAGMVWNNAMEFKFYDDVVVGVNRLLKLNGNTALANSNPLNVVTSTGTGGNLGTLKAEVSFSRYPTAVTYTMLLTDVGFGWVVAVTDTSASRTINLPVANTVPAGWQTTIKDESGGALLNAITVSRSSTDTIEGATSRAINTNYGVLKLYSDGVSKWFII